MRERSLALSAMALLISCGSVQSEVLDFSGTAPSVTIVDTSPNQNGSRLPVTESSYPSLTAGQFTLSNFSRPGPYEFGSYSVNETAKYGATYDGPNARYVPAGLTEDIVNLSAGGLGFILQSIMLDTSYPMAGASVSFIGYMRDVPVFSQIVLLDDLRGFQEATFMGEPLLDRVTFQLNADALNLLFDASQIIVSTPGVVAVPGPIAGASAVPMLVLAGAWFRRRRNKLAASNMASGRDAGEAA